MATAPQARSLGGVEPGRLDSWKQIAAYFGKSERTVRRWQESEGMPVHRHLHRQRGTVWAYQAELDEWLQRRQAGSEPLPEADSPRARLRLWAGLAALTATLVIGWMISRRVVVPSPGLLPDPVPFTALPGKELGPAISPDGSKVAFHWSPPTGPRGIYWKNASSDSMAPVPLVVEEGIFNYSPAWSPDGQTVAFLRRVHGRETWLHLVAASGGPHRRLVRLANAEYQFYANHSHLSWTPDSRWVYAPVADEGRRGLYRISAETGHATRITNPQGRFDIAAAVSPNGRTLAFVRAGIAADASVDEVFRLNLTREGEADGSPQSLYKGASVTSGLAWLPSGNELFLCKAEPGLFAPFNRRLWRLPALKGGQLSLTGIHDCITLAVSRPNARDRGMLILGSADKETSTLRQASLTALDQVAAFAPSTRWDGMPGVSPDGRTVAFLSNRSGSPELWVARIDGSEPRRLTQNAGVRSAPRWSPDGNRLVYAAGGRLFTLDVAGGAPIPIPAMDQATNPSWSTDGRWVYFKRGYQMWRLRPDGSSPVRLFESAVPLHSIAESPDGTSVLFSRGTLYETELCRVPVNGGREVVLQRGMYGIGFALTRTFVYFVSRQDHTLHRMLLAGGPLTRLGVLPGFVSANMPFGSSITVTPDDSRIIYAVRGPEEIDLQVIRDFR